MLRASDEWRRLERQQARAADHSLEEALEIFEALWAEACLLDPDFPRQDDWEYDLQPDFAVARALNGLPPES